MKEDTVIGLQLSPEARIHKTILDLPKDLPKRSWIASLIRANIPEEFWYIDFRSFKGDPKAKELVQNYCTKIHEARKQGFGFLLSGSNGIGKTTLLILTLQEALRNGYTAFYTTLPDIFRLIYRSYQYPSLLPELDRIVEDTEFLAIGELGKDYHRHGSEAYAVSEFDSIFRHRRGRNLPTLMETNMIEVELEDTYGESLISLFRSRLKVIQMKGKDYRVEVQSEETEKFFGKVSSMMQKLKEEAQ